MAKYIKLDELSKVTVVPPKTGHFSQVVTDTEYEKGLAINFGINKQVCGSKRIAMGRTVIPPHTANERHVHLCAEAAMYVVKGTMVLLLGPEAEIIKCPPGTFVFAPEGVVHGVANASRTEEVVLVFAYGGVPSKEAAKIVFIDDSENTYPPAGWDEE
ncbi:MAG: cupin domain-containing protein [Proteobacteria bacterium]|nr:cupin domain-containing protein [Pseudomonadota bacterium]MBU2261119.1 cupin domain-containing protein [Pseudomonadota bacterium]